MRRRPLRLVATLALLGAAACGKRGDPLPPVRVVPQPVTEFHIAQRGSRIEIGGLAPSTTTTGARLPVLDLELQRMVGPGDFERLAVKSVRKVAPGEAFLETEPLPPPGTLLRAAASASVKGLASRRTNVLSLTTWAALGPPSALAATLTAEGVALHWVPALVQPSPPPPVSPGGPQPRAASSPATSSPAGPGPDTRPSPAPSVPPAASPPASPAGVAPAATIAEASPAPAPSPTVPASPVPIAGAPGAGGAAASPSPAPSPHPTPAPTGFWIYRRPKDGAYARPLKPEPIAGPAYLDTAVQPGQEWCYSVRFVAQATPPVESDASNEACVSVRDIAAPAAPAGLALIQGPQGVEISWLANAEPDLAGYRVYRAVEPATIEQAVVRAEIAKGTTVFRDAELTAGLLHAFFVVAVDAAGNESPRSEVVQVRP